MKQRHKRLALVVGGLATLGVAAALLMAAFRQNLVFFYTPSQIQAGQAPHNRSFRMGGMVERGSLQRQADGVTVAFTVSDRVRDIHVQYRGILPDLFREGKGVVAQGKLGDNMLFVADEVLAKHDENYMPPDAAYALKQGEKMRRGAALTGGARP